VYIIVKNELDYLCRAKSTYGVQTTGDSTMKPYKEFRNRSLHEAPKSKSAAPKSKSADSQARADAQANIAEWKRLMDKVQEKIDFLQGVRLKEMSKKLKQAEAKFAAGDYYWIVSELYWLGDLD
jgi:hypothetical protein